MKKENEKSGKSPPNELIQLLIFISIIAAAFILIRALTYQKTFSVAKTVFPGNGIYNTFYYSGTNSDMEIPIPYVETESTLPDETFLKFGTFENSTCGTLISLDGSVIIDVSKDKPTFPASLTKIMTAIVAYEHIPDLSVEITLDQSIFDYTDEENASIAGYAAGETANALDLLYASLMASGADASIALAKYVTASDGGGSEQAFAVLMNEKAAELGCTNTHFVNSTGLHNSDHYSSAYDLARIMAYALQIDTLRAIMSTEYYTTSPTNLNEKGLTFSSTVCSAFKRAGLKMGIIEGGKTGFTYEALQCLASFAELEIEGENMTFILVTLGAGDGTNNTPYNAIDADAVFNIQRQEAETEAEAEAETEAETEAP